MASGWLSAVALLSVSLASFGALADPPPRDVVYDPPAEFAVTRGVNCRASHQRGSGVLAVLPRDQVYQVHRRINGRYEIHTGNAAGEPVVCYGWHAFFEPIAEEF